MRKQENSTFWKAVAMTASGRANVKIENVLKYFLHYSGWKTSPWKHKDIITFPKAWKWQERMKQTGN